MNAHSVDAGDLELGGGLETLVRAALERVVIGGELDVLLSSRAVAYELPAWARISGHSVIAEESVGTGAHRRYVVRMRRGSGSPPRADAAGGPGLLPSLKDGDLRMGALRELEPVAEHADADAGLAPIGASREQGPARYAWRLNDRDRIWADRVSVLSERAARAQWDATTDVPWEAARGLPAHVEQAVAQVMTYVAQNEYAALYVPARFLGQVNPQYTEVLMWLSSHIHDEARHVEVFTKRALAGGARSHALASTELSLHSLLDETDFSSATLLLNVLGEGTFMDLLAFVERNAPDAATATAARLAHRDERRHVQFGISHVRRRLSLGPQERDALVAAAEARSAKLTSLSGLSPVITESLTVMASPSLQPAELAEAAAALRELMKTIDRNRIRRLQLAGFDAPTARHLSDLHTPNLM